METKEIVSPEKRKKTGDINNLDVSLIFREGIRWLKEILPKDCKVYVNQELLDPKKAEAVIYQHLKLRGSAYCSSVDFKTELRSTYNPSRLYTANFQTFVITDQIGDQLNLEGPVEKVEVIYEEDFSKKNLIRKASSGIMKMLKPPTESESLIQGKLFLERLLIL